MGTLHEGLFGFLHPQSIYRSENMFRTKTGEKNEAHIEHKAFFFPGSVAVFEIISTKVTLCVHCELMKAAHLRTAAKR
jgi:hypothetical protein